MRTVRTRGSARPDSRPPPTQPACCGPGEPGPGRPCRRRKSLRRTPRRRSVPATRRMRALAPWEACRRQRPAVRRASSARGRSSHSERHAPIIQRPSRAPRTSGRRGGRAPARRAARRHRRRSRGSGSACRGREGRRGCGRRSRSCPGKARERLDIRIMRSAPMVGKDVHLVPVPLQPRAEKRHRRRAPKAREPGPHGAASSTLAVARENRARPHNGLFIPQPGSSWRMRGASRTLDLDS